MTQKLLPILLALTALIPLSLSARDFTYTYEGQTITYTVIDEAARTCMIVGSYDSDREAYTARNGNDISGHLILPAHPQDGDVVYTLSRLESGAFAECHSLSSVIIPESVSSIGFEAFLGCINLTSVIIPESVKTIFAWAFDGCQGLKSVTIPGSVNEIADDVFSRCWGLRSIIFLTKSNPVKNPSSTFSAAYDIAVELKVYVPSDAISNYANFNGLAKVYANIQSLGVEMDKVTVNTGEELVLALQISPSENTDPNYSVQYSADGFVSAKVEDSKLIINGLKAGNVDLTLTSAQPGIEPLKLNVTINSVPTGPRDFTYTYEGQTITYTVIDEAARTCATKEGVYNWETGVWETGTHAAGHVRLPSHPINNGITYTLTQIAPHSFHDWIELTSIDIANEVTFIGQSAFNGCENLTSVSMPSMVLSIQDGTFSGCKNLTSVDISHVGQIGSSAFSGCSGLQSLSFCYGAEISSYAFMGCSGLTELNLSNVTSIARSSFADCTNLRTVVFSEAIQSIPDEAFTGCTSLEVISFPPLFCNITHIGNSAFSGCSSLKTLEIPESVTQLEHAAFARCSSLKAVFFKSVINPVDSYYSPFINSNAELKVYVPGAAFEQYVNLKDANVYTTIQSLEVEESEVTVDANTSKSVALVIAPAENTDPDYTIEYSVNDIAEAKVVDGSVVITGVKEGTTELTLTSAQPYVEPIKIQVNVTKSPEPTGPRDFTYTYEGQTITYTVIDEAARTCTTKEGVYNWETGVWETGAHASGRVVLPAHPIDNGITYTLTQIAPHSFHDWIELTSIDIANEVTFIGQSAFNGCENLTSVSIPLMVYSIENETFSGCKSLSSVKLSNVGNIGSSAFRDCCGLKSISFSYGAEIGSSAFMGCSGLTELNLSNVTSIGRSSFADCTNLRTVVFSEAIQAVPEEAFTGCTSLEAISFPSLFCNITHIGNSAFSGCSSLTTLELPESVTQIEHAAFARCSSLKTVFFKSLTNPVESYCSPFINSNAELKVYVPGAAFEQYVNLKDANVYATIQSLEVEESEVTVETNTSKSVALVIAPSENTDPDFTIEYSINDIAEAKVVDGSVVITGVKEGTTELTLTSAQPGVEPLHINVTITEPASDPFDISGDGKVDVTDVVNIVDKIIHKTAEIATHDLNGDGKVDVSDIVLLVAHILNGADAKETASRSGEGVTVPVCFDMSGGFTAMQTDVVVAEGTTVENISIHPAIARSHTLGYNEIEPGRYLVIVYSPSNRTMTLDAGEPLFTLAVTGDEHIATEATLFVEAEVVPTGIDSVANEAAVESVSYFDLQGRRVSADATGVLIERTVFTDGTVTTKKVIR